MFGISRYSINSSYHCCHFRNTLFFEHFQLLFYIQMLISYKTLYSILLGHFIPFYATFPSRTISPNHNLPDCVLLLFSCEGVSNSLQCCELEPARLLCPWGFPGKNAGVGCHPFSRGSSRPRDGTHISYIAGRFILYHLSHQGNLISNSSS